MHCPSCRHPLEALILGGRQTGAWQCLKCQGAWLEQAGGGVLVGAWPGAHQPRMEAWVQPMAMLPSGGSSGVSGLSVPGAVRELRPGGVPVLPGASPQNPDWDVCSWCGKSRPGAGPRCLHCNIDRLRCPRCQTMLVGVRRMQVLVDLCMSCQGLWFERGRFELLLERLRGGGEVEARAGEGRPSLLVQLAEFLEATEPGFQTERNRGEVGIWEALASTFGSGVGGGKQVLYDMLTLLGELPGKPKR